MVYCLFQVLTNVLWYVSNSHEIINSAAAKRHDLTAVPDIYTSYQNLNDVQRKKRAKITLEATQLKSHSQALYSILLKPIMNSSASWKVNVGLDINIRAQHLNAGVEIHRESDKLLLYIKYSCTPGLILNIKYTIKSGGFNIKSKLILILNLFLNFWP